MSILVTFKTISWRSALGQFNGELHTKAMINLYYAKFFFQFQVLFVNGKIFFLNCRKISTVTLRYFLNSFLNIVHSWIPVLIVLLLIYCLLFFTFESSVPLMR